MKTAVVLLSVTLAGCTMSWSDRAELAFQTLNGVDTGQTALALADGPCHEANALFPIHASGEAIALGLGIGVAHRYLTRYLEAHDASNGMLAVYHGLSIATKAFAVYHNAQEGC